MTRHVNIDENDVNAIFGFNEWKRFGVKLTESTTEPEHACPLCNSHLTEALSQDTLKEHVATVIQMVEETLAEAADEVDADDESVETDEDDGEEVEVEDSDNEEFEDSDEDD